MNKITPHFWFDKNCEEAINFYVKVFNEAPYSTKNSKINYIARYEKGIDAPGAAEMEGKVITASFDLGGETFMALDGGPVFKFNESISLLVDCKDQMEVDYFWDIFTKDGEESMCGWLKDKFGLSWQIVPKQLGELMGVPDKEKSHRVMNAMLKMKKIIVEDLQKAHDQA